MTAITVIEQQAVASASPCEVLTFHVGPGQYGIDILAVQEIRHYEPPTRIANASLRLLGVMNLRGVIMPVIDLRHALSVPAETGHNTVTIVVNVAGRTVGLVVDAVSEVVALDRGQIHPRPRMGGQPAADFVVGLAQLTDARETLLQLMDLGKLLADL
jgi:purine-binding chemotaxis protein CheW